MKKIAIVGKPNVGKSSLFNRFLKQRKAITSELAGTTRDVNSALIDLEGHEVELLDTGGIDEGSELLGKIREMSLKRAQEADLILYLVDGKAPPSQEDRSLFFKLQHKPCLLVINKIDNDKERQMGWEFASFGAKQSFMISVSHNRGILALKSAILAALDLKDKAPASPLLLESEREESLEDFLNSQESPQEDPQTSIKVGIIGRVNVGKSSLLNALLDQERSVVSEVAGTTIDPVDEEIVFEGRRICFVDTAGIRRRGRIEGIERYALDRTQKVLEQSDIALLVLDVSEGFVQLDERISSLVDRFALGVIVVLNKWDIKEAEFEEIRSQYKRKFPFLEYAPFITASAKTKRHIHTIKEAILKVYANYSRRIPTARLNALIAESTQRHQLPSDHGKMVRIYYATQFGICPPQIALVMNRPQSLHFSYKRYLINRLREEFDFQGTPILISARGKKTQERIELHS